MKPSTTPKRKARAAMTPKQRVLKKYPKAICSRYHGESFVWLELGLTYLGVGPDANAAWADAARRL